MTSGDNKQSAKQIPLRRSADVSKPTCFLNEFLLLLSLCTQGPAVHSVSFLVGWLKRCFTSTETVGLLGTGSPGRPPRL